MHQALEDEDTYRGLYCGIAVLVSKLTNARTREEKHAKTEEILQEAVMQAFAKLDMYDPKRPAVNWLVGFALNIIRQMRQRQSREAAKIDDAPFGIGELSDRLHGEGADELLGLVSQPEQQVLRLAIIEGLSGRELAAQLGITKGAARVRLHRAKQQLRRAYSQLL
jgi:RNA polymerase sigma factor (sigma-70 family)